MVYVIPYQMVPAVGGGFPIILALFLAAASIQFLVPAYFGIRYLGRLPIDDASDTTGWKQVEDAGAAMADEIDVQQVKYKDSPFPFGVTGTMALVIAGPLPIIFVAETYLGPEILPLIIFPAFLFIFLGDVIYNFVRSPFERDRRLVASHTGGGSIFLVHGSWPFFRLMLYDDGLEVRFMFHRFFIPYDRMDDVPEKVGFFNRGILIKSVLPGVPSGIRFSGFGTKKIVREVRELRAKYIAAKEGT